jgi:hypothetical protein
VYLRADVILNNEDSMHDDVLAEIRLETVYFSFVDNEEGMHLISAVW